MKDKTISLNAAIKAICKVCGVMSENERGVKCQYYEDECREIESLKQLPSVPSQPNEDTLYMEYMRGFNKGMVSRPKGHFIYEPRQRLLNETDDGCEYITDYWCKCSECGGDFGFIKMNDAFCKFCGARMVGDDNER